MLRLRALALAGQDAPGAELRFVETDCDRVDEKRGAPNACADVGQVAAKCGLNLNGSSRVLHMVGMIRLGTSADLAAATSVYRRASLSNAGDRDNLLAHPEYLILGPEGG